MISSRKCPRCSFHYGEPFSECPRCGVVLFRYTRRDADLRPPGRRSGAEHVSISRPRAILIRTPAGSRLGRPARALLVGLMAFWWVTLAAGAATEYRLGEIFPHRVNLALHEAGRSVFAPLGKFSEAVGGPLLQLLLPALCGLAFLWRRRDSFGAAVCLWWLGGSLLSMSPYILGGAHFDALLPQGGATGGESLCVYRDWEILLRALGLLEMDHLLAIAAQWIGTLLMGLGTLWSIPLLFRRPQAGESA